MGGRADIWLFILLGWVVNVDLRAQEINQRRWELGFGGLGLNSYAAGRAGQFSSFRPALTEDGAETGSLRSGGFLDGLYDFSKANLSGSIPAYIQIGYRIGDLSEEKHTLGLRIGSSKLNQYGDQEISKVRFSSLEGRLESVLVRYAMIRLHSTIGLGFASLEEDSSSQALIGAGLRVKLGANTSLNIATDYHTALSQNFFDYFSHSLGVSFAIKGSDRDKDGVWDAYDQCPDTPGFKKFMGCPDTDKDGTEDRFDKCVDLPGPEALNGCPDTDEDGISDPIDSCPEVFGKPELGGCPDSDNDGIKDSEDACPNQYGPLKNKGCPIADRDNDTIADSEDQCPDIAGSVANKGCPEPKIPEKVDINELAKTLGFAKGGFVFITESNEVLRQIVQYMFAHPIESYDLVGFTDSVGPDDVNLELSKNRAKRLHDYLISRGIHPSRLTYEGKGELPEDPSLIGVEPHPHRRVEIRIRRPND